MFGSGGVLVDWDPRCLYNKYFDTEEQAEYFSKKTCHNLLFS
ncbi:MAG: hypothetical protein BACD_04136 [Bacteroides rodentium]